MEQNITQKSLVELLNECEAGKLPPDVFEAVARVAVYPAIEFIPLRRVDNKIEVLLFKRPQDDITWPSMTHTPGTILRPTDRTLDDAYMRLIHDELSGVQINLPIFTGSILTRNKRGTCLMLEHVVEVHGKGGTGTFYDVDHLPSSFIPEQTDSLKRAVHYYRKNLMV